MLQPKITNLIQTGSAPSSIRDRIAIIIATELQNQYSLSVSEGNPVPVYNSQVFLEKKSTVELDTLPLVVVNLDSTSVQLRVQSSSSNIYSSVYYLDLYIANISDSMEMDSDTSGQDFSSDNAVSCVYLINAIEEILNSPHYITLGFSPGLILSKKITQIDVDDKNEYIDSTVPATARIAIEVNYTKSTEQIVPLPLSKSVTAIIQGEGEEGTYFLEGFPEEVGLQNPLQFLL